MPAPSLPTLARRGLLLSLAVAAAAPAASNTWNPAIGDGNWNDLTNWTDATSVPGPGDKATFNAVTGTTPTTPHTVTVGTPVTVTDLTIQRTGMTLDVPVGSSLTVTRPGDSSGAFSYGLVLNGGTLNAAGPVTAGFVVFAAGRVNGTVQFADGVGSLLLNGNDSIAGNFQFNGLGRLSGGPIPAGLNIAARQTSAATPGELKLYANVGSPTNSNINYGTITVDSAASITNSSVSILTPLPDLSAVVINSGTINLNAGSSGTNTRTIVGGLSNSSPGVFNVASGVDAFVTKTLINGGKVTVASGASLTVGGMTRGPSTAVTQINGTLNTPNFIYNGVSTVSGTVNIAGAPLLSNGAPSNGARTVNVEVYNPAADGKFVFQGSGEFTGSGGRVASRLTVVGQPVAAEPAAMLRLISSNDNYGTITLAGNNVVNSAVTLRIDTFANVSTTGPGGTLSNYGTLNLYAGGSGTNTRTVTGSISNNSAGLVTVASGVTAAVVSSLSNSGRLTIASGGSLSVPQFSQYDPTGNTTVDGTLSAGSMTFSSAPLRNLLRSGRANNFTAGPVRSTTADASRGLGYATAGGVTTLKATFYGDADLDGGVSINDFNALAANFGQASGRAWTNGDFDYDGGVSINDFNLLAATFGQSLTGPAAVSDYSGLLAFAAAHNDLAAFEAVTGVPEPAAGVGLAAGAWVGSRRRRRRHLSPRGPADLR